ncbi:Exosome complex component RRP45 [Halotydeus destructor]|nr:Exosome complex component RRP45 [Halotydeus destructor]
MKTYDPPNCNKQFVAYSVNANQRLDGRQRDEPRERKVVFGREFGTCIASLGGTRVLAKVTCDIDEPMGSRPSEGMLKISVDLSPMAAPNLSDSRGALDESVEIVRLLERSIRESKAVDMESLCIVSGSKCWRVRIDLVALNSEGNLIECFSLAAISALAHFKRPDVSVTDEKVTVHSFDEKHPLPLTLLHFPFCVRYCFFNSNAHFVVDPLEIEEAVCEGTMVVAGNSYREITTVHVTGNATINTDSIMVCCSRAIDRIKDMSDEVKNILAEDKKSRENNLPTGFANNARSLSSLTERAVKRKEFTIEQDKVEEKIEESFDFAGKSKVYRFNNPELAGVGEGGSSTWDFIELGEEESDMLDPEPPKSKRKPGTPEYRVSDSSDDDVVMLDTKA